MKDKIIFFLITVLIIAGIGFGGYKLLLGRDGLINKIFSEESEFDQTIVLEKFTELVKEKYMEVYNASKENPDINLDESYNPDVAISYFAEKGVLEYYYYSNFDAANNKYTYIKNEEVKEDSGKRDDLYYINIGNIKDIKYFGEGSKYNDNMEINKNNVFVLEKKTENEVTTYSIKYFDREGKEKVVGNLELANPLKK